MSDILQIGLPLALAVIMFAMGLGLTLADFRRVLVQPKDFLVGAVMQVVGLPLVAFALVSVWGVPPVVAVGVMILAACPGGVTSNLLTHLGRGDVALSISLTAVLSLVGFITVPLIVTFALQTFMDAAERPDLPVGATILGVFVITTLPTALGMVVRKLAPRFADWGASHSRNLSSILFILIVLGGVVAEWDLVRDNIATAGPIAIALNLIMLALAHTVATLFGEGAPQKTAIAMECGLQNATLAIIISTNFLGDPAFAIPGGIYGLLMFVSAFAYIKLVAVRHT